MTLVEELLERYDDLVKEYGQYDRYTSGFEEAVEMVEIAEYSPTIDAEPVVHGRWVQVDDYDGEYHWRCSACGIEWWFEVGGPVENGTHYCPNCGAKMEQEGER